MSVDVGSAASGRVVLQALRTAWVLPERIQWLDDELVACSKCDQVFKPYLVDRSYQLFVEAVGTHLIDEGYWGPRRRQ